MLTTTKRIPNEAGNSTKPKEKKRNSILGRLTDGFDRLETLSFDRLETLREGHNKNNNLNPEDNYERMITVSIE